jgi:hypothetical protein
MRNLLMLLAISTGNMNRRSALRTIGAGIVVGLAGCSGSDNNSTSSETLTSSQSTSSSTRTATSEETPTPEETPAQSPKSVSVNISELTGSHTYADVDPQNSRLYPDITGPQSPVGEVWTGFDFPTPFLNLFQNNNIYVLTSGGVGAYDATTGTQQWAVEYRSGPLAAVAGKVILEDGTIISQSDGSIERQLTGDIDAVSKDSIYTYSAEEDYLRKFDLRTGSEQWRVKHPGLGSAVIYQNNLVFYDVSNKNNGLNIFDLSNKSQERIGGELNTEGYTYQIIGVQDGICAVFAPRRKGGTRTTRIIGIEITSGERLWDKQLAKNVFTDYRFTAGSRVYAMTPNEVVVVSVNRNDSDIIKPVVQSYSLEDGSLRWNTELPSLGKNINNLQVYEPSVLITSKSVYVSQLSYDSGISAKTFVLNRSNGSIQIDHTGYTTMIMDSAMFGFKITDSDSTRSVLWAESD